MEKHTNTELQILTSIWGAARLITINGNIPTQTIKFGEEMAELFEATTAEEGKDAIGDMIVVLSMIADLNGTQITKVEFTKNLLPDGINLHNALIVLYGRLCKSVVREATDLNNILANFTIILGAIAGNSGTSINECWNFAYDQIKDRKGKLLKNGNFVKEEDLGD